MLFLASTSAHDSVDKLLHSSTATAPSTAAPDILFAYAEHNASKLVASDIHVQALVAAHHLVNFSPALSGQDGSWHRFDRVRSTLGLEHAATVSRAIFASLADLLDSTSCIVA